MSGLFARLSFPLLAVWTLLIYITLFALPKQSFPLSESLVQFGFAACDLPCWAGITPGLTPFADVPTLYEHNISTPFRRIDSYDISHQLFATSASREYFSGLARTSPLRQIQLVERVLEIELETPLPMWYLIATLGDPTCVSIERLTPTMILMRYTWSSPEYAAEAALYVFDDFRWGMEQMTIDVQIYVPSFYEAISQGRVQGTCESVSNGHWLGFAPLRRYMAFLTTF